MRIYIAGKFEAKARLREAAKALQAAGHIVTSEWLLIDTKYSTYDEGMTLKGIMRAEADQDENNISKSTVFILDTLDVDVNGGRETEWGLARGHGLVLYRVGPRRQVFHDWAHRAFDNWVDLLADPVFSPFAQ